MKGKTVIVNYSQQEPELKCTVLDKVLSCSVPVKNHHKYVVKRDDNSRVLIIYPESITKIIE